MCIIIGLVNLLLLKIASEGHFLIGENMTWLLLGAFICMVLLRISQAFDKSLQLFEILSGFLDIADLF